MLPGWITPDVGTPNVAVDIGGAICGERHGPVVAEFEVLTCVKV
jgi:hypothetical protein